MSIATDQITLVEQALLWVMAEQLGERWTEELATAWRSAYTLLAATMQAAVSAIKPASRRCSSR